MTTENTPNESRFRKFLGDALELCLMIVGIPVIATSIMWGFFFGEDAYKL